MELGSEPPGGVWKAAQQLPCCEPGAACQRHADLCTIEVRIPASAQPQAGGIITAAGSGPAVKAAQEQASGATKLPTTDTMEDALLSTVEDMLLSDADAPVGSDFSACSVQPSSAQAGGNAEPASASAQQGGISTPGALQAAACQQQQQVAAGPQRTQQQLYEQLLQQQQTLLQRVRSVSAQLKHQQSTQQQQQQQQGSSFDIAMPCSADGSAGVMAGAAEVDTRGPRPLKQQQNQSAVPPAVARPPVPLRAPAAGINQTTVDCYEQEQPAVGDLPPAALPRGFGSFFLAVPEEGDEEAEAAAAPTAASGGAAEAAAAEAAAVGDKQHQPAMKPCCTPPPSAEDSQVDSHRQQGEFTDIMLDMLDVVMERFNTQRVSSPSVDGGTSCECTMEAPPQAAAAAAAATGHGAVASPARESGGPAVSDSCSPSNPAAAVALSRLHNMQQQPAGAISAGPGVMEDPSQVPEPFAGSSNSLQATAAAAEAAAACERATAGSAAAAAAAAVACDEPCAADKQHGGRQAGVGGAGEVTGELSLDFMDVLEDGGDGGDGAAAYRSTQKDLGAAAAAAVTAADAAAGSGNAGRPQLQHAAPVPSPQQQQQQQQQQQSASQMQAQHPGSRLVVSPPRSTPAGSHSLVMHVGGVQAQQSVLMQQHVVPLSGLQCLTPRGTISRPTVTTGATHSTHHQQLQQHNNNTNTYNSSPVVVSTWHHPQRSTSHAGEAAAMSADTQQQQQQAVRAEYQSRSHSSLQSSPYETFVTNSSSDDPAVAGNGEEDDLLQQVLPQLTAALEREAGAAVAAAAAAAGSAGGVSSGGTSVSIQQHSSRVVTGPQVQQPHMQVQMQMETQHQRRQSYQQQQQRESQQGGSPFSRVETQTAMCHNMGMHNTQTDPWMLPPPGGQQQHSFSGGPPPSTGRNSQSGRHSLSASAPPTQQGTYSLPSPLMGPQSGSQELLPGRYSQGSGPHGLPRYPSHSGGAVALPSTQQHQQQQQMMVQQQQPAGWGPPSPAAVMQPRHMQQPQQQMHMHYQQRQHYQQQQQQQQYQHYQYQQQQQQQHALGRVHSAPALPQGAVMHGAAAAGAHPGWHPSMQHMSDLRPPGTAGYGNMLVPRTSSGSGTLPPPAGTLPWPHGPPPASDGRRSSAGTGMHVYGQGSRSVSAGGGGPGGAGAGGPPPAAAAAAGGGGVFGRAVETGGNTNAPAEPMGGRTITSLKVTYGGAPLSSGGGGGGSGANNTTSSSSGGGAQGDKPPVKTGTGRPRGRPRKHPLPTSTAPATGAAAAAGPSPLPSQSAQRVSLQHQQQQQQQYSQQQQRGVSWMAGVEAGPAGRTGSGNSQGSGASMMLQRKRSSSFSGLDDPSSELKVKLQRSSGGSVSAGVPVLSSNSGASSGGGGRTAPDLPKPQKKLPKGPPKPTMKDGVMVPPPPGPDMAARGWPPFSDLVVGGYFPPGTYEFSCGTVTRVVATVSPNGLIRWNEETFQSISSFALAVVRTVKPTRQACDGWRECRLKGVKIHEWRAAFLEKREPPVVPPECILKQ